MTLDQVAAFVESLPQVRRKGTEAHPGWYVRDRLVARVLDPTTVLVRVPMEERDALMDAHPATFGVPPKLEAHHKAEVYLEHADPDAVRTAIELAWRMQRR
jgi:hypothetical protein